MDRFYLPTDNASSASYIYALEFSTTTEAAGTALPFEWGGYGAALAHGGTIALPPEQLIPPAAQALYQFCDADSINAASWSLAFQNPKSVIETMAGNDLSRVVLVTHRIDVTQFVMSTDELGLAPVRWVDTAVCAQELGHSGSLELLRYQLGLDDALGRAYGQQPFTALERARTTYALFWYLYDQFHVEHGDGTLDYMVGLSKQQDPFG